VNRRFPTKRQFRRGLHTLALLLGLTSSILARADAAPRDMDKTTSPPERTLLRSIPIGKLYTYSQAL
jgi:hypothetical protein